MFIGYLHVQAVNNTNNGAVLIYKGRNRPVAVCECCQCLPYPQVMLLPMKKALGGDPEVVEARARLTKYKATLSSAVAEAAAAAATRYVRAQRAPLLPLP